ncbi:MAG TPA: aminoacyltransferase, partial [Erysipelothrix sp.]|nr:aminoacyltransferase [Erysipelothrix sp.]
MFEFKESISLQDFDNFASNHEMSSINQSIYWPKIKNNWKPYYTGLYQDNQLVGVALVLIRKVLGFKFAYIPRGPLMDYENREIVRQMMQGLTEFAKKNRYLFVRMDPNINYRIFKLADKETAPILESGKTAIKNLLQAKTKHLGFPTKMSDGFQPRFVAITHHTDDYMVDLPKSTRKSIRDADKLGVKTRLATVDEVDK